ncbi:MAG: pyridoxamine 5'-phosphate oxidase family protein [Haloferacaceae archaeon]
MDHVEYTYTTGMTDEEVEERVRAAEFGVLSLARDGEAYAIPVAFHYDEGRVLLRLGADDDSEKMGFLETTERATLLLYEAPEEDESWSVLLRGPIARIDAAERAAITDADINEWFPPFRVFGESIEDVDYELFELDPDTVTGRKTVGSE